MLTMLKERAVRLNQQYGRYAGWAIRGALAVFMPGTQLGEIIGVCCDMAQSRTPDPDKEQHAQTLLSKLQDDREVVEKIVRCLEQPELRRSLIQLCSVASSSVTFDKTPEQCMELMQQLVSRQLATEQHLRQMNHHIAFLQKGMLSVQRDVAAIFQIHAEFKECVDSFSQLALGLFDPIPFPLEKAHNAADYVTLCLHWTQVIHALQRGDHAALLQNVEKVRSLSSQTSHVALWESTAYAMQSPVQWERIQTSLEQPHPSLKAVATLMQNTREQIERKQQFQQLYEQAIRLLAVDPVVALTLLEQAKTLAPALCDEDFQEKEVFTKAQIQKQEDEKKSVKKQEEAAKRRLAQPPPPSVVDRAKEVSRVTKEPGHSQMGRQLPDELSPPPTSRATKVRGHSQMEGWRPDWLPGRVDRNVSKEETPGRQRDGCLVDLLGLPQGIERKVILARDGSPLLEMVKIPAGEFLMGTDPNGLDPYVSQDWVKKTEMPQKRIYLEDYWIARTTVTNRMWEKFLLESKYNPLAEDHDNDYPERWGGRTAPKDKLDHPAVYISYINAWEFCDFYGLMLPCEAQWEKAARGSDGRIYPWEKPGEKQQPTGDLCNFSGARVDTTTPVGKYPQNEYGLLDCSGNVWEWCADAWDEQWLQKITNENVVCKNRAKNIPVSYRGGSFRCHAWRTRCAFRNGNSPRGCYFDVGVRPAQGTK